MMLVVLKNSNKRSLTSFLTVVFDEFLARKTGTGPLTFHQQALARGTGLEVQFTLQRGEDIMDIKVHTIQLLLKFLTITWLVQSLLFQNTSHIHHFGRLCELNYGYFCIEIKCIQSPLLLKFMKASLIQCSPPAKLCTTRAN